MNRPSLFLVVSLSGAAVLMLEILGTRVLGPFYGVSLFLWSALISVTLAALAIGYTLGGRLATRSPSGARLALLLALAGLWVLALPWLRGPVAAITGGWGLRGAVLGSACVLFLPPLLLLGMVSPYAIRLATRHVDEVGRVAGDLFAVSTLASVAAAVLTGFVLIPSLGVTRLLVVIGAVILAAAGVALAGAGRARALPLVVAALGLGAAGYLRVERVPDGVRFVAESPYAELRVVEHEGFRYLLVDGGTHTIVRAGNLEPRHAYVHAASLAADLQGGPGRLLLIGLGGGSAARTFARRGWTVDAVEIDPRVPEVARAHFGLEPEHARVFVEDGRRFLATATARWDVIFFDAFGSSAVPFHLVTSEAFGLARARLVEGGVLVVNLEAAHWQDPLVHAVAATLRARFAHVVALPTSEPPGDLGNVVLFASDRAMALDDEQLGDPVAALADDDEHVRVLVRRHAWLNRYEPNLGRVLTDDWNPVDLRAEEINRIARRRLRERLPHALLGG